MAADDPPEPVAGRPAREAGGPPTAGSTRPAGLRAAAAAAGVLAALVVAEGALRVAAAVRGTYEIPDEALRARVASPWKASHDAELVYVHRPRARDEPRIESHGVLRPTEVGGRIPGVARVVVAGDSIGAAIYLSHEERFPSIIEAWLTAESRAPVEVLNLCVNGYDTLREARVLETLGSSLDPDAAIVAYCLNDPAESVVPAAWFRDPDPPASYAIDVVVRGVRDLLGSPAGRPLAPGEGPTGRAAPIWRRMYDPGGEPWAGVLRGFDRIAAWSRERNVPVLVVVVPLVDAGDPGGEATAAYRRQVVAAASERGLGVVDLTPILAPHPVTRLRHDASDVYHYGADGHHALAAALVPQVRRLLGR